MMAPRDAWATPTSSSACTAPHNPRLVARNAYPPPNTPTTDSAMKVRSSLGCICPRSAAVTSLWITCSMLGGRSRRAHSQTLDRDDVIRPKDVDVRISTLRSRFFLNCTSPLRTP
jgi:hypothetical protein